MSFRSRRFRSVLAASVLFGLGAGCGKFHQVRECGAFVKTVNVWLASSASADAGVSNDAKPIAREARHTADHYSELSKSLAGLQIQTEELAPRVKRYEAIADDAARVLREVADALDRGDLEQARKKRVDFDTVARLEGPLVKEINGVCR